MLEEFILHEIIKAFPSIVQVARIRPVEVLTEEYVTGVLGILGLANFLMEEEQGLVRLEGKGGPFVFDFMIDWFERQIEHGQGEHHFGKVPGRVNEVARDERLAFGVGGEVVPKGIDQDQVGILLIDGELVVVVFRPFLGRGQFPVKLADSLSFFQSCPEGSIGCPFLFCIDDGFLGHFL